VTVFDVVILFILLILFLSIMHCFYMLYRNNRVYINRLKVIEAIGNYQRFCIQNDIFIEVEFNDMEEYDETLYKRPFDFSCEHILPKEKYEIIKGFM